MALHDQKQIQKTNFLFGLQIGDNGLSRKAADRFRLRW